MQPMSTCRKESIVCTSLYSALANLIEEKYERAQLVRLNMSDFNLVCSIIQVLCVVLEVLTIVYTFLELPAGCYPKFCARIFPLDHFSSKLEKVFHSPNYFLVNIEYQTLTKLSQYLP